MFDIDELMFVIGVLKWIVQRTIQMKRSVMVSTNLLQYATNKCNNNMQLLYANSICNYYMQQ